MHLLFIYNANSGAANALLESAHKLVSPGTYNCKLCQLTHGLVSEKKAWKSFRSQSDIEMTFLHKDEFLKQYRSKWLPKYDFPIVLYKLAHGLEVFLTTEEINQFNDVDQLIHHIKAKQTT